MSGNLVNAFGKISLEDTQMENREILLGILQELRKMNVQLSLLTDTEIKEHDLYPTEES